MKKSLAEPTLVGAGHATRNLTEQIHALHELVRSRYPFIDRVALALYDASTDQVKTFVSSNTDQETLVRYEMTLSEVPSLAELARTRQSRLVNDIQAVYPEPSAHTTWLTEHGYRASYTKPIFQGHGLEAFVFYDAKQPNVFSPEVADFLDTFSDLIVQLFMLQRRVVEGMIGTVQVAVGLARIRDLETGQHLERIAHYSRLMARAVADDYGLSDEYIEYITLFAPLHDIGKVGIPDQILLKQGRLGADEYAVMKRHVQIGEMIIDKMGIEMGLEAGLPARIMRNIVSHHHERGDGSGYPLGLKMADISVEGRIVAVADIYDALMNQRPYKKPWPMSAVEEELQREARLGQLDPRCVEAFLRCRDERLAIMQRFIDAS